MFDGRSSLSPILDMPRRTKHQALETRSRLLDAAEELFQQRGVSRTSLHDIALAAGLTRGAIYWHFDDKADLFNAMIERVCLPLEEDAACAGHATHDDPLGHIRSRMIDIFKRTVRDDRVRRVFEIATHKVEYVDEMRAVRERHLRTRAVCLVKIEQTLRHARRSGSLRASVPLRSTALALHALVDGLIQSWMLDPGSFDLVRVGRDAVDALLCGIRPPRREVSPGSNRPLPVRRPAA